MADINHVSVNARHLRESVDRYRVPKAAFRPSGWRSDAHTYTCSNATCGPTKDIWDINPQTDDNMRARLFLPR